MVICRTEGGPDVALVRSLPRIEHESDCGLELFCESSEIWTIAGVRDFFDLMKALPKRRWISLTASTRYIRRSLANNKSAARRVERRLKEALAGREILCKRQPITATCCLIRCGFEAID